MENVMKRLNIDPKWVILDLEAKTDEDAILKLATTLVKDNIVKESFLEAVIQRERDTSTGLQCDGIGVAIPHTDSEHVNEQAISIGLLRNPVIFKQMGYPEIEVAVSIVLLLAIKEPHQQVQFLQALMGLFANQEALMKLANSTTKQAVIQIFNEYFKKEEI